MEVTDQPKHVSSVLVRRLRARWGRPVAVGLTAGILIVAAFSTVAAYQLVTIGDPGLRFGIDLAIMLELGRRWIETGSMYLPYQLAGPHAIDVTADLSKTPALYPPAAGPVFGALTLLPFPLVVAAWWAVPIGIVVAGIWRWRPAEAHHASVRASRNVGSWSPGSGAGGRRRGRGRLWRSASSTR